MLFIVVAYIIALISVIISYWLDKKKTKVIIMNMLNTLKNLLPLVISVLLIVIPLVAFINSERIVKILSGLRGIWGVIIAGIVGSISYIPAVFAYPLSAQLLSIGTGYAQITMFISTVSIICFVGLPIEIKCIGKRVALKRNIMGFIQSLCISYIMSMILSYF